MALFFDGTWFDARLAKLNLSRENVASALGISEAEIVEVWKDQRELAARDVAILAALLGVTEEEIASRAGVSTPTPSSTPSLRDISDRLARIEERLAEIASLLRERK